MVLNVVTIRAYMVDYTCLEMWLQSVLMHDWNRDWRIWIGCLSYIDIEFDINNILSYLKLILNHFPLEQK